MGVVGPLAVEVAGPLGIVVGIVGPLPVAGALGPLDDGVVGPLGPLGVVVVVGVGVGVGVKKSVRPAASPPTSLTFLGCMVCLVCALQTQECCLNDQLWQTNLCPQADLSFVGLVLSQ